VLWQLWRSLNNDNVVEIKAGLSVAGAIVLLWYWLAEDVPRLRAGRRWRDLSLALIGIASCASWWNFGRFHFDPFIHYHEMYHYYLGAKYAPELGFTRLYECTIAAEDEFAHLGPALERVAVRDLTNNVLGDASAALAHPERCKEHFSPERWQAFMRDSDYFRRASSWHYWSDALNDNGYNATPVWRLVAGVLANRVDEMNDDELKTLADLDPILLFAMMILIWWAFGWRTLCVALIFFGNNYPARYWWTGGAFLRMDWLFAMVAGICCMKRGRPATAGALVAWSALLRIFPGFIAVPLLLKVAIASWRARKLSITTAQRRFIVGAAVTVAVLMPISTAYSGGIECWRGFVANSAKHLSTPLTNNMGWRTVIAYDLRTRAQVDRDGRLREPFSRWKYDQLENFRKRKAVYFIGLVAFLALLGMAAFRHDDWVGLTLGTGLIIFAAQLTSYYFIAFLAFGLLWPYLKWSGWALSLTSAISCWIPLRFLGWDDDRYVAISIVYILFVLAVTGALAHVSSVPPAPCPRTNERGTRSRQRRAASRGSTRPGRG
jgi:hypothetical protein